MWSFASDMSFLRLSAARSVCQAMRRCTRAVAFQNAPTALDRRWKMILGFEAERGTAAVKRIAADDISRWFSTYEYIIGTARRVLEL